jgi:hypothetical protein
MASKSSYTDSMSSAITSSVNGIAHPAVTLAQVDGYLDHPVKGASAVFAVLFFISAVLYIYQNL